MATFMEVALELRADGFAHSDSTKLSARVLKLRSEGTFRCEFDQRLHEIDCPAGEFSSLGEARAAIFNYWGQCEALLAENPAVWR